MSVKKFCFHLIGFLLKYHYIQIVKRQTFHLMFKQERHKMIRTYNEKDNEFLNENAPLAVLEILYHKDVITDSIVTSVDSEDNVNGVAYLKYHYT